MADMIKFFKGLEASLPTSGVNGALYITTDEGAIYLGTGTGMKRLGDFVQVANVAALPEKAHESCLYYCVAENILAKWNGTEWKQINKQPTAEELKGLLGLASLAYKSEVAEADLNADLAAKINASTAANHGHDNKAELDKIADGDVAKWNAAEKNAKDYADGLNTAMNTRVEALEAVDHTHDNKALLDTYTQTEADLADAVAKKHAHTFVESELNKIVDGDVAKWNAVAADYLDSEDETTLKNLIKEAKQAGVDADTYIKAYEVTNDARVKAVEDDIAEIVDGTDGILAQAKSYADGKDSAMNTRVAALEAVAPTHALKTEVEAVNAKFANYNTTVAQKAIDDAQDAEIAKKVDKVEGKSLVADTEITKLAGVSEGANKVEKSDTNGNIKVDGQEVVVYTHPDKHAISNVTGLQDALDGLQAKGDYAVEGHKHVKADITDFAHTHTASEITDLDATIKGYDYATKTEAQGYADAKDEAIVAAKKAGDDAQKTADDITAYVGTFTASEGVDTVVKYIDAKTANIASDERVNGIDNRVKAIEDNYLVEADKTELSNAINAEKERAEGIEGGLRTDVDAIKADYLKGADKTELEGKITAEENRAKGVEESLQTQINTIMNNPDTEGVINSINEFTQYISDHGAIADGFRTDIDKNKEDIAANAKAIEDHAALAAETYVTKDEAVTSWNDLTDKPFGEKCVREAITFEPTEEALASGVYVNGYFKISDELLTEADFEGAIITTVTKYNGAVSEKEANIDYNYDGEMSVGGGLVLVVPNRTWQYSEPGTYILCASDRYVSNITFTAESVETKIDEKYLPENPAAVEIRVQYDDNTHDVITTATYFTILDIIRDKKVPYLKVNDWSICFCSSVSESQIEFIDYGLNQNDRSVTYFVFKSDSTVYAAFTEGGLVLGHELEVKADKATSLSGYGIDDAYTKTEVDTLIADNAYTKEEVYTQAEVDAAIEAAVTEATSWGEF